MLHVISSVGVGGVTIAGRSSIVRHARDRGGKDATTTTTTTMDSQPGRCSQRRVWANVSRAHTVCLCSAEAPRRAAPQAQPQRAIQRGTVSTEDGSSSCGFSAQDKPMHMVDHWFVDVVGRWLFDIGCSLAAAALRVAPMVRMPHQRSQARGDTVRKQAAALELHLNWHISAPAASLHKAACHFCPRRSWAQPAQGASPPATFALGKRR
eukprot:352279-Chlamydomonas_euryale.AAC.4